MPGKNRLSNPSIFWSARSEGANHSIILDTDMAAPLTAAYHQALDLGSSRTPAPKEHAISIKGK